MATLDSHDPALLAHSVSVSYWTTHFGMRLGLDRDRLHSLEIAAILHDVGKLTVSPAVLSSSGVLAPEELTLVRNHPIAGYEILRAEAVHPEKVLEIVRYHHERLDGSGYPCGLRGVQIHTDVRIVTICDVYAALTENRPYNRPMGREEALRRMAEQCVQLDMDLLRVFGEVAYSVKTSNAPQARQCNRVR